MTLIRCQIKNTHSLRYDFTNPLTFSQGEYVAPVQEEEKRQAGSVRAATYIRYFYYGAGVLGIILLILLNLAAQAAYILSDWWLSHW